MLFLACFSQSQAGWQYTNDQGEPTALPVCIVRDPLTSFDVSPEGAESTYWTGTLQHLEMTTMQVKFAVKNLLPPLKEAVSKAGHTEWRLTEYAFSPTELWAFIYKYTVFYRIKSLVKTRTPC